MKLPSLGRISGILAFTSLRRISGNLAFTLKFSAFPI